MAPASNDMGFGFGDDAGQQAADDGGDWANAFGGGDDSSSASFPVNFAAPEATIVLNSSQAGQKGQAGLQVKASFFKNEQQ